MAKASGGRYSSFKEPSVGGGSRTAEKIARRFGCSNWLLECCCGSCYANSASHRNDTNETRDKEISEPAVETSRILSSDITELRAKNGVELATEAILLAKRNYEESKDDRFPATRNAVKNEEEISLIDRKDSSSISDSRSKSSSNGATLSGGIKRVIDSLPVLPKTEKKPLPLATYDEKKASESNSEIGYPGNLFVKCSKRYRKESATNIPELVLSQ